MIMYKDTMKCRSACIFCSGEVHEIFTDDIMDVPQSYIMQDSPEPQCAVMPFNIQKCNHCRTMQTKYLADPTILYQSNHYVPYGSTRSVMLDRFVDFIIQDKPDGLLEIGGGNGHLFEALVAKYNVAYTIVDPAYIGPRSNTLTVLDGFYEDIVVPHGNNVIMSHFFEHVYDPVSVLERLRANHVKHIYLCHPDFDAYAAKDSLTMNMLHLEHTFYTSNADLVALFARHSFHLERYEHILGYSVLMKFSTSPELGIDYVPRVPVDALTSDTYVRAITDRVKMLNTRLSMDTSGKPVYMWPCSIHSVILFNYGLDHTQISGFLDNSPFKVGKFMYGYNIPCLSFEETVINRNPDQESIVVIINGGCFTAELSLAEKCNVEFML